MAADKTVEGKKRRRKKSAASESEMQENKGRATPSRRGGSTTAKPGNFLTRPFSGIINYLREVKQELDKVTWPTREDTIRLTYVVLIVTVISSLALGGLSLFADLLVRLSLQTPAIFGVAFAVAIGATVYYMRRGSSGGY